MAFVVTSGMSIWDTTHGVGNTLAYRSQKNRRAIRRLVRKTQLLFCEDGFQSAGDIFVC